MPTKCIDIADNKKLGHASPVAMAAFLICFIIMNIFITIGFLWFILTAIIYIITQVFFQYTPRVIWLSLRFMGKSTRLSPSFPDLLYVPDEARFNEIRKIMDDETVVEG
jgi:hypothetical protein